MAVFQGSRSSNRRSLALHALARCKAVRADRKRDRRPAGQVRVCQATYLSVFEPRECVVASEAKKTADMVTGVVVVDAEANKWRLAHRALAILGVKQSLDVVWAHSVHRPEVIAFRRVSRHARQRFGALATRFTSARQAIFRAAHPREVCRRFHLLTTRALLYFGRPKVNASLVLVLPFGRGFAPALFAPPGDTKSIARINVEGVERFISQAPRTDFHGWSLP
jgi:hypothetical protein